MTEVPADEFYNTARPVMRGPATGRRQLLTRSTDKLNDKNNDATENNCQHCLRQQTAGSGSNQTPDAQDAF